eukprot:SAG31_NODE_34630_length_331_cov_0.668103_1_plen_109_part_11
MYVQRDCNAVYNPGAHQVDALFERSYRIIRYDRGNTPFAYMRRVTPLKAGMSIHKMMLDEWTDYGNVAGVDFRIYSTEEDARNDANPWQHCAFTPDVGFPGSCGPTEST